MKQSNKIFVKVYYVVITMLFLSLTIRSLYDLIVSLTPEAIIPLLFYFTATATLIIIKKT